MGVFQQGQAISQGSVAPAPQFLGPPCAQTVWNSNFCMVIKLDDEARLSAKNETQMLTRDLFTAAKVIFLNNTL